MTLIWSFAFRTKEMVCPEGTPILEMNLHLKRPLTSTSILVVALAGGSDRREIM